MRRHFEQRFVQGSGEMPMLLLFQVPPHGAIPDGDGRVVVAALDLAAAGAAGHEHALAVLRRHATERGVFERSDGHRRHLAPAGHAARRHAPPLAETAVGFVAAVLQLEQRSGQVVELRVGARVLGQERQQAVDQGLHRRRQGRAHGVLRQRRHITVAAAA